MEKKEILFCTSNEEKLRDLVQILVTETQGDPRDIALFKTKEAYQKLKKPVLTDDTCLCFNAFKGLPGPYIKEFLLNLGARGVYDLLEKFEDKSGYSLSTFGYADENGVKIFEGRTDGTIVSPRGEVNISWNSIFQPEGYDKTFAELTFEQKNLVSQRYKAAIKLRVC